MAELIMRPTFFEGQILAAGDLTESVEYARSSLARHERYLHTWGIGAGLRLVGEPRTAPDGTPFKSVTVRAGFAIDPSGRQIVVTDDETLSESLFDLVNGGRTEPDAWYPVFLVGLDEEVAPPAGLGGACGVGASSRTAEGYEVTFGRLGDESELEGQPVPEFGEGPAGAATERKSRVLLGFVQWQESISRFKDVSDRPEAIGPRYAGVTADEVVARGGSLTLRSRPVPEAGKPAVVVDERPNGGELQFGLQDARGKVTPVFTVNAKGDVTAEGKLTSALTAGVQVESGVATDGMLVPLPKGIKAEQVAAGQVVLHVHVTPRYDDLGTPPIDPVICTVAGRRVHCRFAAAAGATVPGRCDFTVLAFVTPTEGGGSP